MKKKIAAILLTSAVFALEAGCSADVAKDEPITRTDAADIDSPDNTKQSENPEISEASGTDNAEDEYVYDTDSLFTGWLPTGIEQIMSETSPNELLRQTIIDYYEIPEEFWVETRYYYNYVDLDDDGTDEIFAVISGSYTSGSGGDSALWCRENNGKMQINQAFTLVNSPVIVTKEASNGAKPLIMQRWGGGADPEIVQLTYKDGKYGNVSDAEVLDAAKGIEGIKGTAIICNNLIKDMENGEGLTLAE